MKTYKLVMKSISRYFEFCSISKIPIKLLIFWCTITPSLIPSYLKAQDSTILGLKADASSIEIKKDPEDTIGSSWRKGGIFNLNLNQGSLTNWAAGGEKFSFSINTYLNLFAFYKTEKHSWDNTIDLAFGWVQTTSQGKRKSSDRIDMTTKYGRSISQKINVSSLFNIRSQFANGYTYTKDDAGKEVGKKISTTLNPAYVLLSLGLDYKPKDNFSMVMSPMTGRWVVVSDTTLGPLYGLKPGKKFKNELGAFVSMNYQVTTAKAISYKTKIDLFSNYKTNPENIDIFWTNVISAAITKYINVSLNFDMIYDDNTRNVVAGKGPAPQWLQLMGIGFAYKFAKTSKQD